MIPIFFIFLMLIFSCSHQVSLSPTIHPSSFTANKLPHKVGVVFSSDIKTMLNMLLQAVMCVVRIVLILK